MIEARMVRLRESDHELARALIAGVYLHPGLLEPSRVHESHQLEEQVGLDFEQVRGFLPDGRFKFLRIISRNAVPRLCLSPVHCKRSVDRS